MEHRFWQRLSRLNRWGLGAIASLLIGILATPGSAFIGFKVAGVCLAACGSDSLLNRGASIIGSAFTDGAVQHFGEEGRRVVDYADSKAQERLQQLSTMLDDQRKLSIRDLALQRQLFFNNLNSLVNTAATDLRNVLFSALNQLDQSLQDALDKLDATLRTNVGAMHSAQLRHQKKGPNYGKRKLHLHGGLGKIGPTFGLADSFDPKAGFTYESCDLICRERHANRGPIAVRWIKKLKQAS